MPVPVLCFPFAGAGASAFRRWQEYPSETVRVVPVQLPGREERYGEPLPSSVSEIVDGLLPELPGLVGDARRVALFGHSLGAVLAYETALRLADVDRVEVVRLVVSGSPGPWTRRERRATGLSDEQFLDRVREFAGYTHPALQHPDLRELLLPTLRADVAVHEDYLAPPGAVLRVPVTSVRGADDELVSPAQAAEWEAASTGPYERVELPGNHMYLVDGPAAMVRLFERVLAAPRVAP